MGINVLQIISEIRVGLEIQGNRMQCSHDKVFDPLSNRRFLRFPEVMIGIKYGLAFTYYSRSQVVWNESVCWL